jgi:hypothetical protein
VAPPSSTGIGHGVASVDEPAEELAESESAFAGVPARHVRRVEGANGFFQRFSPDKAHGVEGPSVRVMPHPVDGHGPGVFERPGDFRFEDEAGSAARVVGVPLPDFLEGYFPVSSDIYFSRSATLRIPDRPRAEQGANDNYFSRSERQSGLLR